MGDIDKEEYFRDLVELMDVDLDESDKERILNILMKTMGNPELAEVIEVILTFVYRISAKLKKLDKRLEKLE